jgi:UPF0755 protein
MLPRKKIRKRNNNKKINKAIILLIASFFLLFFIYNRAVSLPSGPGEERTFIVSQGEGAVSIASNLKKEGLIRSEYFFKLYSIFSGARDSFRSGSHTLSPEMNIKEITAELTKKIYLRPEERVTFIEGWNLRDYAKILEEKDLIDSDSFFSLVGEPLIDYRLKGGDFYPRDYSNIFSFLESKPLHYSLEGYLFPDTYNFFTDSDPDDIIIRILRNFDQRLSSEMRKEIDRQGKSIHEILTMASIIEKEVRSVDDMRIVSGIFWNRIRSGQALQSCATLAYILGINKAQYSYEDTRVNSPYNTYINRGLPPGPISNPGIRAIEAAIYPENTSYNYFLTSSITGETIFSRTYEEHVINKNRHIR